MWGAVGVCIYFWLVGLPQTPYKWCRSCLLALWFLVNAIIVLLVYIAVFGDALKYFLKKLYYLNIIIFRSLRHKIFPIPTHNYQPEFWG